MLTRLKPRIKYSAENVSLHVEFLLIAFSISFCLFAFLIDGVGGSIEGLIKIIFSRDVLLTDYIELAGIGGAFLNSGLVMLITILIFNFARIPFFGVTTASILLMGGFALFGKNVLNILPIILGGYLYTKVNKEEFTSFAYAIVFSTTLSPVVSEVGYLLNINPTLEGILMILAGILVGYLVPAVSVHTVRVHQGYNLYNVGMAAGLIGMIVVSLLKSFGFKFSSDILWSEKYQVELIVFFSIVFALMFLYGFYLNGFKFKGMKHFTKHSGRAIADYIVLEGLPKTLINMSLLGFMSMGYVVVIGSHINGPTLGGILTVVGFGAFGKHIKNVIPLVLGVVLASFMMNWQLNEPAMVLAALFATGLAPIAGQFGFTWGIITGIIHATVVREVGALHGWLNLYNNGFCAGLICIVIVPIIEAHRNSR